MLVLDGHESAVFALAFSPDGGRLASGDRVGNVLLWAGGEPVRVAATNPPGAAPVNSLAFAPNDVLVVAGGQAGWYGVRLGGDGQPVTASVVQMPLGATGVRPVGPELLAVGLGSRSKPQGGAFAVVNPYATKRQSEFPAPQGVRSVSAAGEVVAWSEWGRLLYVWDIRKPDRVKLPLAAEAPCVALAPDGTQLAAGVDYVVKLFDVAGKRERLSLAGHRGKVTSVAFTPDGGTVVSGSWDGTVRLWDAGPGTERASFRWPVGKVTSLAIAPDGLRLAVGGDAGAIVLADLD